MVVALGQQYNVGEKPTVIFLFFPVSSFRGLNDFSQTSLSLIKASEFTTTVRTVVPPPIFQSLSCAAAPPPGPPPPRPTAVVEEANVANDHHERDGSAGGCSLSDTGSSSAQVPSVDHKKLFRPNLIVEFGEDSPSFRRKVDVLDRNVEGE